MTETYQFRLTSVTNAGGDFQRIHSEWETVKTSDFSFGFEHEGTRFNIQIRDKPEVAWGTRITHSDGGGDPHEGIYLGEPSTTDFDGHDAIVIFIGSQSPELVYLDDCEPMP